MCHHKAPLSPWQPSEKYKDIFADRDIPEPDNLYDHYEGRTRGVAAVTMKVGEDMLKTDIKTCAAYRVSTPQRQCPFRGQCYLSSQCPA